MVEALNSSETSVNIYQTARYSIPEDSHRLLVAVRTLNLTKKCLYVKGSIYIYPIS
jgi:hypothetical protein